MSAPICPICDDLFAVDDRFFYFQDKEKVHTCESCYRGLIGLLWERIFCGGRKNADERKILRQRLGLPPRK